MSGRRGGGGGRGRRGGGRGEYTARTASLKNLTRSEDGGGRDRGGREGRGRGGRDGGRGGRFRGGGDGGRGGRFRGGDGGRGGGRGRGPDLSRINKVLTNYLDAKVSDSFSFYQYMVDSRKADDDAIESRGRRHELFRRGVWDGIFGNMEDREKADWKRVVHFVGSYFFSSRPIPGLEPENLPHELVRAEDGDTMTCLSVSHWGAPTSLVGAEAQLVQSAGNLRLDTFRCANCTATFQSRQHLLQHCRDTAVNSPNSPHSPVYAEGAPSSGPARDELFLAYVNLALQRALGERLQKWGGEYVDRDRPIEGKDRQGRPLDIDLYEAYSCTFRLIQSPRDRTRAQLAMVCDLRAKVIRTKSVLDALQDSRDTRGGWTPVERRRAVNQWVGQVVIYTQDKKRLDFDHTPQTLPIPGKNISHLEYFRQKGIQLKHPNVAPMVEVMGRRKQNIYFPPELVAGNELDPKVREMLPQIASFPPERRNAAIEKLQKYLLPGAQRTRGAGGLLPSLGVVLQSSRMEVTAEVLPAPFLAAAGVRVPVGKTEFFAPNVSSAKFNISPGQATTLKVVLVTNSRLKKGAEKVYRMIRDNVNKFQAAYRLGDRPHDFVEAGDMERHWGAIERYFSQPMPSNVFVIDFVKPKGALDPAYPVVKKLLCASGYLSQFVNFKTCPHDAPTNEKKSTMILQGVARQILQKAGARLWRGEIPRGIPLPAIFIGVDVFHAPMVYDPKTKTKGRKASCAAVIVQLLRNSSGSARNETIEIYSETFKRSGGEELHLQGCLKECVRNALREFKVHPMSVVTWRDGVGESEFSGEAAKEIAGIREAVSSAPTAVGQKREGTPVTNLAYIVCQKRIPEKFLTVGVEGYTDGALGAPSGTLVQSLQFLSHATFFINGRAPPFSTPKPVRFTVLQREGAFERTSLSELTWSQCHEYPNWTGPVKVPAVCQMAHKLAELAGSFSDCGDSIDAQKFTNRLYFL